MILAVKYQKAYCNDFLTIQICANLLPIPYAKALKFGQITDLKANSVEIRLGVGVYLSIFSNTRGVKKCVFISATESLSMYLKNVLVYY